MPRHRGGREPLTGIVDKNARGFAFILTKGGDYYVSREDARSLLNGDEVLFDVQRKGGRLSAHIHKILARGATECIGQVMDDGYLRTMKDEFFQISTPNRPRRQWVLARIEKYPDSRRPGVAAIEKVLGHTLLSSHDLDVAVANFNLPHKFPSSVLAEVETAREQFESSLESSERTDLRHLPFVTIDGEDAKDFDDAIYVEARTGKTAFVLYVAIADVSFFVRPGTPVDREAKRRGTSVYFPGSVIPMLPEVLSNDLCSLRPREDKFTLTAEIHFDHSANVLSTKFHQSIIKTIDRLTYRQVQQFTDDKFKSSEPACKAVKDAYHLYKRLWKKRSDRGVLEFLLRESFVTIDKEGKPIKLGVREHFESHELIEEFMIAANQAVAFALQEQERDALYRVHESPDPASLERIEVLAKSLGFPARLVGATSHELARLLNVSRSSAAQETLHRSLLRAQKQARYDPRPLGHFGLALADYCHFTSPIRRYPDLVVHRALRGIMKNVKNADTNSEEDFEQLGERTSRLERRATDAERFMVKRKQCWFMKEHLGEEFTGRITDVMNSGFFVEIAQWAVEGFVPIDSLKGNFVFEEAHLTLIERKSQRTFSIGDSIKIQVASSDVDDGKITFYPSGK